MAAELLTDASRALDANANPYAGAKLYFYATGTLTPQSVYTTAALNIAHTNPVVADSGGQFPPIYFDSSKRYRGILENATGTTTIYDIDPINSGVLSELGLNTGATNIGYSAPGTGSIDERIADMLDKAVFLDSKGADRAGTDTSNTAMLRALETGRPIAIQSGIYNFGNASGTALFDLEDYGAGVNFIPTGDVLMKCNTTTDAITPFFFLNGNSDFYAGKMKFTDTGYIAQASPFHGAVAYMASGNAGAMENIVIDAIHCDDMLSPMIITGGNNTTNRVRGVSIRQIIANNCYYGFNAQDQGDGVKIDQLIAYQNFRTYFVYGVKDHNVNILSRANRSTSGAVNIGRLAGGNDTSGITVKYVAREQTQDITHVLIDHIDLLGGKIKNIDVTVDIESSSLYYPVRFVNYDGSGNESASASSNEVSGVRIRGVCDAQARDITTVAAYASKRVIEIERARGVRASQSVYDAFYLNDTVRGTAGITWTASSSNPSLGDGTLLYDADFVAGGAVAVTATLTWGSTTTAGTGVWSFQLPYTAKRRTVGTVFVFDNGTGTRGGTCVMEAGSDIVTLYPAEASSVPFGAAVPITWATSDRVTFDILVPLC